jgi:hypothetical protein
MMARSDRFLLLILAAAVITAPDALAADRDPFAACRVNTPSAARLGCDDTLRPILVQLPQMGEDAGAWRLVSTRDPQGGPDAVSITHVADLSRSDADLAGLMVRCTEESFEVVVIVVAPRPPVARPRVIIGSPGHEKTYAARVVPPFSALLLPPDATAQVTALASEGADLSVEIDSESLPVRGVIELAGLPQALDNLNVNCPRR